jgi:hypothetical protein
MTKTHILDEKFFAEIFLNDQNLNLNSENHFCIAEQFECN